MYISKSDWAALEPDHKNLTTILKQIRDLRAALDTASSKSWSPLAQEALAAFHDSLPSEATIAELAGE